MAGRLLSALPGTSITTGPPPKGSGKPVTAGMIEGPPLEALWLLCRTQMGAIEAALLELGYAADSVAAERMKWHSVNAASWSWMLCEFFTDASHYAHKQFAKVRGKPMKSSKPQLGRARTRIGMGARRRALLCSERVLAQRAGILHDLRVALRSTGGEWLELGRWLGGPPLESMDWEVQLDPERRLELLQLCVRVLEHFEETSATMRRLGPYRMYQETVSHVPPEQITPLDAAASLGFTPRAEHWKAEHGDGSTEALTLSLVDATRRQLRALKMIRKGAQSAVPDSVASPGPLQRHSASWLTLLAAIGVFVSYILPRLPEGWQETTQKWLRHNIHYTYVFMQTHLREPITAVIRELFHGTQPTIDPAQVRETKASLHRMLEEFVRDVVPPEPTSAFEEKVRRARDGSMEVVTSVYESQMRLPIRSIVFGDLSRALLLQMQQLKLLMEEEVEAVDVLLQRNDFNLQLMATVPALFLLLLWLSLLRQLWRTVRSNKRGDPIELIRSQLRGIDSILNRASDRGRDGVGCLTQFESSSMEVSEVGELVFRVQRLRHAAAWWLRGKLRNEVLNDAQELLDSGRLSVKQRSIIARSLLRRMDNLNALFHHW